MTIAFIGLGGMGHHMAANLLKSGQPTLRDAMAQGDADLDLAAPGKHAARRGGLG